MEVTDMHGGRRHRAAASDTGAPSGHGHGGAESVLPRILAVVFAITLARVLLRIGRRASGHSQWRDRRREAIARLHRELHQAESA
jgi:hypothetical protein